MPPVRPVMPAGISAANRLQSVLTSRISTPPPLPVQNQLPVSQPAPRSSASINPMLSIEQVAKGNLNPSITPNFFKMFFL